MKNKAPLSDRQVKDLERMKDQLITMSLSPERYRDTTSNVGVLLHDMIKNIDSILAYCKDDSKRR